MHSEELVNKCKVQSLLVAVCLLLLAVAAVAQTPSQVWITALVRPSVLFSGATPDGTEFAQGGYESASILIPLLADTKQKFSTRAVVANNPLSSGYALRARLRAPTTTTVVFDGVTLSTTDAVISRDNAYRVPQNHTVTMTDATADVLLVVTCAPN